MPRKRSDYDHVELAKRPESAYWQFKYYDPATRKVRFRSTNTLDRYEAERLLRELIRNGGAAALRSSATGRSTVLTVDMALDAYCVEHADHLPSAEQARIAKAHLTAYFGRLPVEDLDKAEQQGYVDDRLIAGRAPKTVSRELSVLRASLYFARENGKLSAVPKIYDLPDIEGRTRWLTETEFAKLLGAAKSPHLSLYMLLGVATAGRTSSILDLRWDQIDFAAGIIHLNPYGREQTAKTRPTVRMTEQLKTALEIAYAYRETEYVIEYAGYAVNSIRTAFAETAKRAGFDDGDVTPYTLRHTAATWLAKEGVALWDIAHLLGHSTIRMVEKHYAHFDPTFQEKTIAVLQRQLGSASLAPQPGQQGKKRRTPPEAEQGRERAEKGRGLKGLPGGLGDGGRDRD